jgi:hypothetical protein
MRRGRQGVPKDTLGTKIDRGDDAASVLSSTLVRHALPSGSTVEPPP